MKQISQILRSVMKALLQGICGHPANVVRGARNYPCADVPGKRAAFHQVFYYL